MGIRLRAKHQDEIREKIKTSQIVTRLTNHALGELKVEMSDSQVRAALGLLKKSLPDLTHAVITGADGGAIECKWLP